MNPPAFVGIFAILALLDCLVAISSPEPVSCAIVVVAVALGAVLGLVTANAYVRHRFSGKNAESFVWWRRLVVYVVGIPIALVLVAKMPYVPTLGAFAGTGLWITLLVMATTTSAAVATWWNSVRVRSEPV
jgi:hypothetical protein